MYHDLVTAYKSLIFKSLFNVEEASDKCLQ